MKFDIVIHNGIIITVNADFDIIEEGMICVKNGKISDVGKKPSDRPLPEADQVIDAKGGIILPGLVNTHTHLPMSLFRGLADDLPLMNWLNEYIFPAEAKYITPGSVRIGTLLACAELILSGTTTCCDGYFYENQVAEAVSATGMRAVLGQGVSDIPAPGSCNPKKNVQKALEFAEKWQGASSLIRPSIFCHSPYSCSVETIKNAKAAANSKGLLFQIHAAETKNEWDHIYSKYQTSPIKHLDQAGILNPNTLLIHTIWVDESDIETIAKRGAHVSHNPESNMKLASGIAPVPAFLKAGLTVGLGTDGCASNNNLDLFSEMDFTAKLHKVNTLDPTIMDAGSVLKMATIDGAKAIGLENEIGSLDIGKQADIIIIDVCSPHLVPMYNPVSHIVYSAGGADIRDVIVAGNMLVRDHKLLTLALGDILEEAAFLSKSIQLELGVSG